MILPSSVDSRVIPPICEGFISMKDAKFRKNKTLAKISEFTIASQLAKNLENSDLAIMYKRTVNKCKMTSDQGK